MENVYFILLNRRKKFNNIKKKSKRKLKHIKDYSQEY